MPEIFIPLIIIGIGALLTGPVALVISIIALNKAKGSSLQSQPPKTMASPIQPPRETLPLSAAPKPQPPEKVEELPFAAIVKPAVPSPPPKVDIPKPIKTASLEQRIGTRWILIAGIVCVFIAVGFFINYAYKYFTMGPLGKTLCIGICGLIALTVGEITRRRGYDIVAKGVTSLGFAILYATVFSAYRFYALIEATPAFAIATLITASALIYAIRLDEVLIAFLSLLGGFLTPAIVSTGQNLPGPLFTYLLILSLGALACSYFRKWPSINLLAFLGTFALYTGWFEKFYRPDMKQTSQMTVTLTWLGVFFAVYLILPLLHGLIKKARAYKQDATLILMNATVTFYYLWTILHADHRTALALCAVALCVIHLILLAIVRGRCKDDTNLHLILLAVGLFFLLQIFLLTSD